MKVELDGNSRSEAPAETAFAFLSDPTAVCAAVAVFQGVEGCERGKPSRWAGDRRSANPRHGLRSAVKRVEKVAPERARYKSSGRHALGMVDSELGFSVAQSGGRFDGALASASVVQRNAGLARAGHSDAAGQASDQAHGENLSGALSRRRAARRLPLPDRTRPRAAGCLPNARRRLEHFRRKEDNRLVRGFGRFVDDEGGGSVLHMKLVRSPYAHARIAEYRYVRRAGHGRRRLHAHRIGGRGADHEIHPDGAAAGRQDRRLLHGDRQGPLPGRAGGRRGGATSPAIAADAVELVRVEYEPLPAVTDAVESLKDEVMLHEASGTNKTWGSVFDWGEVDKRLCASRDRHRDRPAEISSLFVDSARELCGARQLGGRRPARCAFCNIIQPGVAMKFMAPALAHLDRAGPHPHSGHRRRLRHQAEHLSISDDCRSVFDARPDTSR